MVINIIRKIRHICIGWFNRIFKRNIHLYDKRIQICNTCEYKEKILNEEFCGKCWCAIKSKLLVEDEHCADNRW